MEKYRGVFDYPHVRSGNLLPEGAGHEICPFKSCGGAGDIPKEHPAASPASTSKHVTQFMGWGAGKKLQYTGVPAGRVLAQEEKWEQLWLRKGRYEDARQRERQAEKESVSASEPAIS